MTGRLHTRICDLFDIEVPIVLAGMGQAATPALAAAVSDAGGLGVLGATGCSPDQLRRWIAETRERTDRPFGVDTILPASIRRSGSGGGPPDTLDGHAAFAADFMQEHGLDPVGGDDIARAMGVELAGADGPAPLTQAFFEAQMEVVIEEQVPVYAAGLGSPGPWMDRLRAGGTKVISVVGAVHHVASAVDVGVDAIVAQGSDGGGHNSPIGTMALIPQVVDAAAGVPVLGAGGIGDGRGIAAALMLGAEGVWIGTAFLATEESGLPHHQKLALVGAGSGDTMVSRSVTGKPVRLLRGSWAEAWERSGRDALPMPWQSWVAGPVIGSAAVHERADVDPGIAGQGIGLVDAIRPAADVVADLVAVTEQLLG